MNRSPLPNLLVDEAAVAALRHHLRPPDEFVPEPSVHVPDRASGAALAPLVETLAAIGLLRYADCYFDVLDGEEVFVEVWVLHPDLLSRLAVQLPPPPVA